MNVTTETADEVVVVEPRITTLDAGNADHFKSEMAPIANSASNIVLDLSHLEFVDSSGCGAILSCFRTLNGKGGDLKLCNVQKNVRSIFQLIRIHRVVDILNSREDAIAAFWPAQAARHNLPNAQPAESH